MSIARTAMAALIASLGLTAVSRTAEAAGPHVAELAGQLRCQAQELRTEFSIHFRQTPHFGHLVSDASLIYAKAARIQAVARFSNNLSLLQRDVAELDRLFHHMEGLVPDVRRYGSHGHGGHNPLWKTYRLIAEMENTLHHLRQDLTVVGSGPHSPVPVPLPVPAPDYGVGYGPGHGGQGSWGGGHGGYGGHGGAPSGYVPGTNYGGSPSRYVPGSSHGGISFGDGNFRFRITF